MKRLSIESQIKVPAVDIEIKRMGQWVSNTKVPSSNPLSLQPDVGNLRNQSLKYQRFTSSGCKYIGIVRLEWG